MSDDEIEREEKQGEEQVESGAFHWMVIVLILGVIAAILAYWPSLVFKP